MTTTRERFRYDYRFVGGAQSRPYATEAICLTLDHFAASSSLEWE